MSTIKDVAALSGTSIGTVSRYLNDHRIKEENREKIETAIKILNFKANPIARGLKTNKTFTIGVVIPRISNSFIMEVIDGMEDIFERYGYSIIVCDSRESIKKEEKKLYFLKDKYIDGIVIMPVENHEPHIEMIKQSGIPVVLIDRLIKNIKCDAVICDNINGAYKATEKMINYGHRKIGVIAGPQNVFTAEERLEGYKRALKDYNIKFDENHVVYSDYNEQGAYESVKELFNRKINLTAIFTSNYDSTMGVLRYMFDNGIVIGKDISLFGFDLTDVSRLLNPNLSVVIQPMKEIGKCAAELLIKRINGDYNTFPIIKRLKTKVVITESIKRLSI